MTLFDQGPRDRGPSRSRPHGHLGVLRVSVLIAFGILTLRLANMQIVNGAEYRERAENNHIQTEQLLPARGLIYDRNGEALVRNVGVYSATIIPQFLPTYVNDSLREQEERRAIYLYLEAMLDVPALSIEAQVARAELEGLEARPLHI